MTPLRQITGAEDPYSHIFRALALAALTLIAIYLCWLMTAPFLSAFTWAFALAVAFFPIRRWLTSRMSGLTATVLIMTSLVVAVSLPGALVARQLLNECLRAQQLLQESLQGGGWRGAVAARPWIGNFLAWTDSQLDLGQMGQQLAGTMARSIAPLLARSVGLISQAGVILLALFFFLQDEAILLAGARSLLPLSTGETDALIARVSATVRATVYGRLLIGIVQGTLGGLIFALVGLPAALFWGVVMMLLSLLPVFGAFLVWVPASLFLVAQEHWIRGIIVAVWGFAIIHPVDNLLYPALVGEKIGLHPLVLFVAFVGGLVVFGPAGLIIGPCLMSLAAGLAEVWRARSIDVAPQNRTKAE
jgi:predicted PurR-regulated permease PerM